MSSTLSHDSHIDNKSDVDRGKTTTTNLNGNPNLNSNNKQSVLSNGNVSDEKQQYVGVGFGNNYFGVFGSEALSLLSPSELVVDSNDNSCFENSEEEEEEDTVKEEVEQDSVIPPCAFILPLGGSTKNHRITQKCVKPKMTTNGKKNNDHDDECEQWSAGGTHSCTLHPDGEVTMTGTLQGHVFFQNVGRNVMSFRLPLKCTMLASGRRHTLALMEQGAVALSWGSGYFGQLGHGTSYESQPRIIHQILPPQLGASHIHTIAAGAYTSAAILHYKTSSRAKGNPKGKSRLFAWGSNRWGQCTGRSKSNAVPFPAALDEIWNTSNSMIKKIKNSSIGNHHHILPENNDNDMHLVDVSLGQWHGVVRTSDNDAYIWGKCHDGTSKRRSTVTPPTKLTFGTSQQQQQQHVKVIQVCSGEAHSLFLTMPNNKVYSWGCGHDGQLGLGSTFLGFTTRPRPVMTLAHLNVQKIAAGGHYSAAITESGHLYTWGYGDAKQLGHVIPADLPVIEPPGYTSGMTAPPTQCKGLDSRFNITVPTCVSFLRDNHCVVERVECGACHMHVLCRAPITDDVDVITNDNNPDSNNKVTYLDLFLKHQLLTQQGKLLKPVSKLKDTDETSTETSGTSAPIRSFSTKSVNKLSIKRFFCKSMSVRQCTSRNSYL